jgi:hypothetical protein
MFEYTQKHPPHTLICCMKFPDTPYHRTNSRIFCRSPVLHLCLLLCLTKETRLQKCAGALPMPTTGVGASRRKLGMLTVQKANGVLIYCINNFNKLILRYIKYEVSAQESCRCDESLPKVVAARDNENLCSTTTPQTPCNRQLVKLFTCCGSRSSPTGRGHGANRRRQPSCWPGSRCPRPSCSRSGRSSGSHQPAQKRERWTSIHGLPHWLDNLATTIDHQRVFSGNTMEMAATLELLTNEQELHLGVKGRSLLAVKCVELHN